MTSTRSAIEITEWEGLEHKKRTWNSRGLALAAMLAATYAAYVILFGFASFAVLQFRIVDALLPLSILFGFPAVVGLTIGVFVGNFLSPYSLGAIDVVGGTAANFVAATLAWSIGRRGFKGAWVTAVLVEIAAVTIIVGSYVVVITTPAGVPLWAGWLLFLGGEVLPIGIIGYPLLRAVERSGVAQTFKTGENPS
ncbi:MAG: QueT transporter family protein [Nitrososphaerales archaeon]